MKFKILNKVFGSGSAPARDRFAFLALVKDIESFPKTDSLGVLLLDDIKMKENCGMMQIYLTASTQEYSYETIGESDSKSFKVKFIGSHPGTEQQALEFATNFTEEEFVVLIPQCNKGIKVLGSPDSPLIFTSSHKSVKDSEKFNFVFEQEVGSEQIYMLYDGIITLNTNIDIDMKDFLELLKGYIKIDGSNLTDAQKQNLRTILGIGGGNIATEDLTLKENRSFNLKAFVLNFFSNVGLAKVGINKANPTQALEVVGNIKTDGLVISEGGTPDEVGSVKRNGNEILFKTSAGWETIMLKGDYVSDSHGIISPDTPAPVGGWKIGWYTPKLSSPLPGTNYALQNNLKSVEGFFTEFYFDGNTWSDVKKAIPQAPANLRLWSPLPFSKDEQVVHDSVIYIALENVLATDVPGVSDKWKSLGSDDEDVRKALKWFLEQQSGVLDKTFEISNIASYGNLYGVANNPAKLLRKTNALVDYSEAGTYFNVWKNIPTRTNGIKKIIAKILPYGNNPADLQNANIVGLKEDGSVAPLVLFSGTNSGGLMTYELDITEYESISVGLVNFDSNPISLTQTIEFYKVGAGQSIENSVKNYIDENGGGISAEFDATTTTEAQGGKQIADWILANEKPAGASSDLEVYEKWTNESTVKAGTTSPRFNNMSISFINAVGVDKLIVTMRTNSGNVDEEGQPIYGQLHNGTLENIYTQRGVTLTDHVITIDPLKYKKIFVNADNGFYAPIPSNSKIQVSRSGSGSSNSQIYAPASVSEDVETISDVLKYFVDDEVENTIGAESGFYTINGVVHSSGGFFAIRNLPATGIYKIKFTGRTAQVGNPCVAVYGQKHDNTYEDIFNLVDQDLINQDVLIDDTKFKLIFINFRSGSVTPIIKAYSKKNTLNSVKNYIDNSSGGGGLNINRTVIFAEALGVKESESASNNTSILQGIFEANKDLGATVVLPCGKIKVSNLNLPNSISLIGSGRHWLGTHLIGTTAGIMLNIYKHYNGDMLGSISNMVINGNGASTTGIFINSGMAFFKISDMCFFSCTDFMVETKGALIFHVTDCRVGGGMNGFKIRAGDGFFANLITFTNVQFGSLAGRATDINGGSQIVFNSCDWENNGTVGDMSTGNILASGLSALGEGVDLTFNNCWSEVTYGGYWLNMQGTSGVTVFRDTMVWQPPATGSAPVGIINNGNKILLTGSTSLKGFPTDIRTTNNGQTRVDGFATVGTHSEATGGTFKTNNASYI